MYTIESGEFAHLPSEYLQPTAEWTPPLREKGSIKEPGQPAETTAEPTGTTPSVELRQKKSGVKQKLKTYALAAVASAAVVTTLTAVSDWDTDRARGLLWEHPLAYYAESAEALEYYAENELWYQIFGAGPDGHEGEFYGMYGRSADGPTDAFRNAFTLDTEPHFDEDKQQGLPIYNYSLELPDHTVFQWEIQPLENERQVIAAWMENGEVHSTVLEAPSDDPNSKLTVVCNYDIDIDENGNPAERVWVFGNGVDVVGVWEAGHAYGNEYITVHATPEHAQDPTGSGPSYLITFTHKPMKNE